jgi:hypothetical protein
LRSIFLRGFLHIFRNPPRSGSFTGIHQCAERTLALLCAAQQTLADEGPELVIFPVNLAFTDTLQGNVHSCQGRMVEPTENHRKLLSPNSASTLCNNVGSNAGTPFLSCGAGADPCAQDILDVPRSGHGLATVWLSSSLYEARAAPD